METELSTPKTRRESEVWQACDDLWAQTSSARHLTGDNIRDQLIKLGYKRGSPNEIYRYRSSWKDSRGITEGPESPQEGDARASDPISRAVSLVYDQIRSQASDALDKLTEDYEARLKASLLEEESLKESLSKMKTLKTEVEQELAAAKVAIGELEQEREEEIRNRLVLNEKVKAAKEQLEYVANEHRNLVLELKSFHEREIDLWRVQNNELKQMLIEQKKQAQADAERQGAVFSEELMALKMQLRQAHEEREMAKAKTTVLDESLKELRAREARRDELDEKQRKETLNWQRRIERAMQRKAPRPAPIPGSKSQKKRQ